MNELSTQDIRVRTTAILIDSRISYFANRSHGQSVVVKKDTLMKGRGSWVLVRKEAEKIICDIMKRRKIDFALIATHAKQRIDVGGARKRFSMPMKCMAERTFNVHPSKAINLSSRIKGLASDRI